MSFLNQIAGVFSLSNDQTDFIIYTNEALDPNVDEATLETLEAIRFTSLYDIAYKDQVNIAYEPLENSEFSSDSIQDTPFTLFLTGIVAPISTGKNYTNEDYRAELEETLNQLKDYLHNKVILTILRNKPLFTIYPNLKMVSFSYDLTPDHTNLKAYMSFQEFRITTSSQFGSLPQNQVADPADASQVNNGNQIPTTPARESSITVELVGNEDG